MIDYLDFKSCSSHNPVNPDSDLQQHFSRVWYGGLYDGYGNSTLRMLNDKHWMSDVVTGAGIGIISTKLAYLAYPLIKRNLGFHSKLMLVPSYQHGQYGFSMADGLN